MNKPFLLAMLGAITVAAAATFAAVAVKAVGWRTSIWWASIALALANLPLTYGGRAWPGWKYGLCAITAGVLYGIGWTFYEMAVAIGKPGVVSSLYDINGAIMAVTCLFLFGWELSVIEWLGVALVASGCLLLGHG